MNEEETILDLIDEARSLDLLLCVVFDIHNILNRKLRLQQDCITPNFKKIVTSITKKIKEISEHDPHLLLILDECNDYIKKIEFMDNKTINFIKCGYHQPTN